MKSIIFNGEMIGVILEGRKDMTRRLKCLEDVNNYPGTNLRYFGLAQSDYYIKDKKGYAKNPGLYHMFQGEQPSKRKINPIPVKSPYQVGDKVYVKETWRYSAHENGDLCPCYRADNMCQCGRRSKVPVNSLAIKWKSPLHLKEVDARIILEITDIKVERVQDISGEDAIREGVRAKLINDTFYPVGYVFKELWTSIYGIDNPKSWESNPYVFAYIFKRVK